MKKTYEEEQPNIHEGNEDRSLKVLQWFFGVLFVLMALYILYLLTFEREDILNRKENNRYTNSETGVIRGKILTADGAVIAETEAGGSASADVRSYPYGALFADITGYTAMGRTGLEAYCQKELMSSGESLKNRFVNALNGERDKGMQVVTTIDSDLQYFCYQLLGDYTGSITVMEPESGKIIAMVTKPTYDPNTVKENWSTLTSEDNATGNLLNRSTQGLYAPGSTFKLVTLTEYIRENPETYQDFHYNCTGEITVDGETVHCEAGAHGELDLQGALAVSCNCAFIEMGMTLNKESLSELCQDLGFSEKVISELPSSVSQMTVNGDSSDFELMQTVFGQGNTMETPLLNCMITSMIANDGVLMKPYLIDHIENAEGKALKTTKQKKLNEILTREQADFITECMMACIYEGTSPQAQSDFCTVAGKSGTAQYSSSLESTHAWFTAFFPAEEPVLSVTVMLEKGGHGSPEAAPLVKQIIDYYYTR